MIQEEQEEFRQDILQTQYLDKQEEIKTAELYSDANKVLDKEENAVIIINKAFDALQTELTNYGHIIDDNVLFELVRR